MIWFRSFHNRDRCPKILKLRYEGYFAQRIGAQILQVFFEEANLTYLHVSCEERLDDSGI